MLPPGRDSRLHAAVLRINHGRRRSIEVVAVLGIAESLKHLSHQALDSGTVSSLAMKPTMDPVKLAAKEPLGPGLSPGAVVGPRDSGQQRSITVPSGQ